jgi:hypothetical protein
MDEAQKEIRQMIGEMMINAIVQKHDSSAMAQRITDLNNENAALKAQIEALKQAKE